ncbi:MAG: LacI family DNA-binding transcriptional regulator [Cyclobacteriaceae bacterium]
MKKRKVTIHDIARELKVDSSTVSRALSNSPRVKPKTRELVLKMADELGYQPNALASNLRKSRSNTIGVVVPRISRHFFSSVIAGIDEITYQAGYNVLICQSLDEFEREKKLVKTLLSNQVDGVLMSVSMETSDIGHLTDLENNGIPLVFFDRFNDGLKAGRVVIDDFKAAYEATEHLIENGCRSIVHFSGPQDVNIYKDRFNGYVSALQKNGLEVKEDHILTSRLMGDDGVSCVDQLMDWPVLPDGIFSANDTAAIGAVKRFRELGVEIPKDVAIVGFSNEPVSSVLEPPLTTIDQPGFEMGKMASNMLLEDIKNPGKRPPAQTITIDSKLIVRKSSIR